MQHGDIWRGIDLLAQTHGLTASGLAKLAGLDATAFNKSKRFPKDGRPRWPSTESISRVLQAVGVDFEDFAELVTGQRGLVLPVLRHGVPEPADFFDDEGYPQTHGHETMRLPDDSRARGWFVFEVASSALDPTYQRGDKMIVSRFAPLRNGDRVLIKPMSRDVIIGTLFRQSQDQLELISLAEDGLSLTLNRTDLDWIARILWVSQ